MTSTAPITAPRMVHSIYGRKFGLDVNGCEVSAENAIIAHTSATTGTNLPNFGVVTLTSATATWQMVPPIPGISVLVQRLSSSTSTTATLNLQMTGSTNVTLITSSQTTAQTLTFTGPASIWMMGLSTSVWSAQLGYSTASSLGITVA